uniref:Prokaryotic-type class I peptide chain release factors domain-containing protein n=1 Tax=Globodera rostochiensis TaxID=31243 RepID=A0A914H3Q8_GLORO
MPPILPSSFIHRLPNFFVQFGYRPFCSSTTRFTNDTSDSDQGGDDANFFEGLYFAGEIPRDRIKQKFTLASGPGGSNINKNPTKAEIRFLVEKADWIPRRVRERLVERHPGCVNKRGEFAFTSQITRYQHQNMEDCFRRLHNMLLDCSEDLVREVHREYVSPDHVKELELRKERSEEYRLAGKSQNSRKKQNQIGHINRMESAADDPQVSGAIQRIAAKKAGISWQKPKLSNSSVNAHGCRRRCFYLSRASRLLLMIALTFAFFLIELVFGYISHSMALIADSFHMMSDVIALCIAFGCLKIAERRKSSKNTFGWVRAEVLGALVNGVFLLALCFTIFIESVQRLLKPEPIKNPVNVLIVGLIGFFINLIGMIMFRGHVGHTHAAHGVEDVRSEVHEVVTEAAAAAMAADGCGVSPLLVATADERRRRRHKQQRQGNNGGKEYNDDDEEDNRVISMSELEAVEESLMSRAPPRSKNSKSPHGSHLNMHAVFLHVLSDAVGSVIVIATALVAWKVEGYEVLKLYMDPLLSIILVCLMVCTTFPLVRETALILLQTTPSFVSIDSLQAELLGIDGIVAVHEFHVWRLVGERIIATVHIRFRTLRDYVLAAEQIRSLFHDNHIHSTTIQPEWTPSANVSELECAFACLPNNCNVLESVDVTCCGKDKRTPPKKFVHASTSVTIEEEQQQQPNAASNGGGGGNGSNNCSSSASSSTER